jgi:hypothetical protein
MQVNCTNYKVLYNILTSFLHFISFGYKMLISICRINNNSLLFVKVSSRVTQIWDNLYTNPVALINVLICVGSL